VEVLSRGMRVLIYSGQYDITCNHLGTEKMLEELQWAGRDAWVQAQPGVWLVDKQPAGYIKTYKNLQSLLVLNAGHMVPMDVPKHAFDMIARFLADQDFSSGSAVVGVSLVNPDEGKCDARKRGSSLTTAIKRMFGYNVSSTRRARPARHQHVRRVLLLAGNASSDSDSDGAAADADASTGAALPAGYCAAAPRASALCTVSVALALGPFDFDARPLAWTASEAFSGYDRLLRDLLAQVRLSARI